MRGGGTYLRRGISSCFAFVTCSDRRQTAADKHHHQQNQRTTSTRIRHDDDYTQR